MAWSCVRGGAGCGVRERLFTRGFSGPGTGCPGQWSGSQVLESKECLDNILRHWVWILGGLVWSQQLDLEILVGPFQLRVFYDLLVDKKSPRSTLGQLTFVKGVLSGGESSCL